MNRKATIKLARTGFKAEVSIELRSKRPCAPYLTIDLELIEGEVTELSITMVSWRVEGRRWREDSFGQWIDTIREYEGTARLCDLWERWHLNEMRAGTRAQSEALRDPRFQPAGYPASHYDEACKFLAVQGLNPDKGYSYGSAWLTELLPAEVVTELEAIVSQLGGAWFDA